MRERQEQYDPTEIINDENGQALNDPKMIMNRWRQYFNELLSLQQEDQLNTQRKHNKHKYRIRTKYNTFRD
uniref:Uncharacterized protein n=1 Tax=Arion vulgaris TaxID=1028688 RepID=A0A0B7B3X5_9EUPU